MPFRGVVLGSLNVDLVMRSPRLPVAGENIIGGPFEMIPGGKGVNQAVALARLGASVTLIGAVGADSFGAFMHEALARENLNLEHLCTLDAVATGTAIITVDDAGENTIVVALGANDELTPERARPALASIPGSDGLVMQLEAPVDTILEAANTARAAGVPVTLNAAPPRPVPAELLEAVDTLIVNEFEARALAESGHDDLEMMARQLASCGPRQVVVTLGAAGAIWSDGTRSIRRPAFQVDARDATAAGDAFVAGFNLGDLSTGDPEEALRLGAAAGALAASRLGAMPSLPDRASVDAFLDGAAPR
ncbi:MAG: ribokinase [Phycisphaerales bacterium]